MDTPISTPLLWEVKAAFEQKEDLPFPVHVSDFAGNLHFANEAACKLFKIQDPQHIKNFNLTLFYENPKEREHLLEHLKKHSHGTWLNDLTARLNIEGYRCKVKFASKPFFDAHDELKFMLNVADHMSTIEWFAEFEDDIESGLFEVDHHLRLVGCNKKLAQMLGYDSPDDIRNYHIALFLWEQGSKQNLVNELNETAHLHNRTLKLRRKDKGMMIVRMSCIAIKWDDGEIAHVKGIVHDVIFEILQKELPVGLFLINTNEGEADIFSHVNATFAKIHGFKAPEEVIGLPADCFQMGDPESHTKYKNEMDKAAKSGQPLVDYYMEIYDNQGNKKNVVVNVCYIPGEDQNIRVGTVYDVTKHESKHRRVLEMNFSAVLHTYIATINGLRDTLNLLIRTHGPGISYNETAYIVQSKSLQEINSRRKNTERLLAKLAEIVSERESGISQLSNIQKSWNRIVTGVPAGGGELEYSDKDNAAWGRRNLIQILKNLDSLRNSSLPNELLRSIRLEIEGMLLLSSIITLSISVEEINERIPDFYYFRDFLRQGGEKFQDMKSQNLTAIIADAILHLEEYAVTQRVKIEKHFNTRDLLTVFGNKTALGRAFHSLLHNAIKYSWSKGLERRPWVDIRIEKKLNKVEIVIENWGVPIRQEELENDLILQFGQRGRDSEDRGRAGTGIGLYDANEIIKAHGGNLVITSEPTIGNPPRNYTNPFITRVRVTFPLFKEL